VTCLFDLTADSTSSSSSSYFADRIVATPCLSVANAGQAACEALLKHAQLPRVGAIEHDSLVPVVYVVDGDVAVACEVFHSPSTRVTVVQRRAPKQGVRGAARRFAADLVQAVQRGGARALVLATGVDHGALDTAHRRPLVFATAHCGADSDLSSRLAALPALVVNDVAIVSRDSTFSRFVFAAAVECGLPLVILAVPVAEGADEAEQIRPLVGMLQALL
jgi:hypothetical protein